MSPSYPAVILSFLNLSFNTHLRKLRFCNLNFYSPHTLSSTIPSMFAKITSSYIYEIEFAYGLPDEERFLLELENDAMFATPGSSMWTALDTVLSGFSGLHTVRFRLCPRQSDPLSFVGYVRKGLSSCNARGLLSFEHVIDGMSESDPGLGACHSPPLCTERDNSQPYSRPAFCNGVVSGPFCITQL
jgi:hypothetical protein